MRTITRNPNPPACLTRQPQGQDWRDFMGTPCHQQVNQSLREEQHHLCCYCEVEIKSDDSHIDHMVPRSARQGRDYDYANLAASCDGGAVEHCGRFKDDRHQNPRHRHDPAMFCPPHDPGAVRLLQYLPNGSVVPATGLSQQDEQKARYMIGHLGLQCARLTGRRRAHARQLMDTLGPTPDPALIAWAIDHYLNPDPENRLRQFPSLSRKMLDQ